MLPDRVSNPGPLTYESGALPIALRGPAFFNHTNHNPLHSLSLSPSHCPDITIILLKKDVKSLIHPSICSVLFVVHFRNTVKILKIGTPEIISIIVLQLEQLDFTEQYCVQKMQTE